MAEYEGLKMLKDPVGLRVPAAFSSSTVIDNVPSTPSAGLADGPLT